MIQGDDHLLVVLVRLLPFSELRIALFTSVPAMGDPRFCKPRSLRGCSKSRVCLIFQAFLGDRALKNGISRT